MVHQSQSPCNEYLINAAALKAIESDSPVTLAGVIMPMIDDSVAKATAAAATAATNSTNYLAGS